MKNKKGFSLVELLAVIVLLGVIMLIAVPSYSKYIEKTKIAKCEADKAAIIDATKSFITDCIYKNVCATSIPISNYTDYTDYTETPTLIVENLISTSFMSEEFEKYGELTITIAENEIDGVSDYEVLINDSNFNNLCK